MDEKIQAIHDSDLVGILTRLGLLEKIEDGEIFCYFCNKKIDLENLHGVFPVDGKIYVSCDTLECVKKLALIVENRKRMDAR